MLGQRFLRTARARVLTRSFGTKRPTTTVGDVLEHRARRKQGEGRAELTTLDLSATQGECCLIMGEKKVGSVVVVDEEEVVGFITERAVVQKVSTVTNIMPIQSLASSTPIFVRSGSSVEHAINTMRDHRIRHLVVVSDDAKSLSVSTMVGVVSLKDCILRSTTAEAPMLLRRLDTSARDLTPAYRTIENSSVQMDMKVSEVVKRMNETNSGAVVVLDQALSNGGRLVGMFSERTYLREVLGKSKDPTSVEVGAVMEGGRKHMVHADAPLFECLQIFAASGLHYVPVYEDHPQWRHEKQIVGIMAIRDLIGEPGEGGDGTQTWFEA